MYLLLIEDNADLAANTGEYMEEHGHIVDYAIDGPTGLRLAAANDYDAVILDVSLPGLDGLNLCRRVREEADSDVPILMLTARDTLRDKLRGFEAGADDYLTKPFSLSELKARLESLTRRVQGRQRTLRIADLVFDTRTLVVKRGDKRLQLTATGLRLLELLMRVSPAVVSHASLERAIWGDIPPESDASLRGHIHQLRGVVDRPFRVKLLKTVRGIGYRLADDASL